jgi:hypothetical protein
MLNLTLPRKFECVGLETNQNLNDSLLVRRYHGCLFIQEEVIIIQLFIFFEFIIKIDKFLIGLLLLDRDNFLDGINNIKLGDIFSELISPYLGIIKQILNGEVHQITAVVLCPDAVLQLL